MYSISSGTIYIHMQDRRAFAGTVNTDSFRVDGQVGEVAGDVALTEEIDLPDDEALIQRVMDDVMETSGVELDQLINPSKVVNLRETLSSSLQSLRRARIKRGS